MFVHARSRIPLLLALTLAAAACGSSNSDSTNENASTAPSITEPSNESTESDSSTDTTVADSSVGDETYFSFGNAAADTVVVVAQGGPVIEHETDQVQDLFADIDLDATQVVLPHQAQTLDPQRFADDAISFDEAKTFDMETTAILGDVVESFVEQDRNVIVVGISFGAFVVQDLLATQGNIADGYLIQVGRLDMPAEVWEPFSEGRFVGFSDGVTVVDVDSDDAGMGGDGDFTEPNMARLAAGLGFNRYTELLADVDLTNVVYAYGELDEQVGRLTFDELEFLDTNGVQVIQTDGGHGETIDASLVPGLEMFLDDSNFTGTGTGTDDTSTENSGNDEEDAGYLPAEDVESYVAAFQTGLAASSVTFGGSTFPVRYASADSAIVIVTTDGAVTLAVGNEGLEGATVETQQRQWTVQEDPNVTATPEALGGSGDMLSLTFTAVADDNPADSIEVGVDLSINLIGMGDSVVEVIDGYATISGTLGTSTYVQLSDVMANDPEVDTLVMLNVHGSENDEINVHTARLVRDAGWTTWVPSNGDISSGGVDMFVAGVDRIVEPGGFVGVHSWGAGDGELTGRDHPKDSPVHRSQLEYFTEMMGDEAGTEFYFYTLEAAPFDQIYRMTTADTAEYGLITADAPTALPASVIGAPAGYLELTEGSYLKLQVESCEVTGGEVDASLFNNEFGPIDIAVADGAGQLSIPALEGVAPVEHDVSDAATADGVVSGTADLVLDGIVERDTSNAPFEFPCAAD